MNQIAMNSNNSIFAVDNIIKNILPYYNFTNAKVSLIKFKDTEKQRAIYKVDAFNKTYCLKKVYYPIDELLYVYSALEWLHRNDLHVTRLISTKNGGRFVEYNNMLFILTPWIDGKKCNFDNNDNVLSAATSLAKLHKKAKNFMPITSCSKRENISNYYHSTLKHFEQLISLSVYAKSYKDRFSKEFLNLYEKNLKLAEISLKYASIIDESNLSISLCHGDYVNKNLIFDKDNNLYIIDFDKCKKDYCSHDISYFLRRYLKRENTNWNLNYAISFLKYYNSVNLISSDDMKYIISYLAFPQKFFKISKDYYKIKDTYDSALKKLLFQSLTKSSNALDYQLKFINELTNKLIKHNWNITLV